MTNNTLHILVVEDEWVNAQYVAQILEELGHRVVGIAGSSKEAFVLLQQHSVHMIFMDINLSYKEDGITLAKAINEKKPVPIIYMTAYGDAQTIQETSQTNIYGFIIKPFSEAEVHSTLLVAQQRLKSEHQEMSRQKSCLDLGFNYSYNLHEKSLYCNNILVVLSKKERMLMEVFTKNYGTTVSVERLREEVWENKEVGNSTIRESISRLRKKIDPLKIEKVSNIGYALQQGVL